MPGIFFILLVVGLGIFLQSSLKKKAPVVLPVQEEVAAILLQRVAYYSRLSHSEKLRFRQDVMAFMGRVKITGQGTAVTAVDRVLVAASGVIPIFAFAGWQYPNLKEVLLYSNTFSYEFNYSEKTEDHNILGMVGSGAMNNMMILSKPALHAGYDNRTDKNNTAIHEFTHLVDKTDGEVDGIPELLIDKANAVPWLHLIHKNIMAIKDKASDINPYGATNEEEFFAVAAEYFFERPLLFKQKHEELYYMMEKIFNQRPTTDSRKK